MVDSHKKRINSSGAWREAKRLIADHRSRLALGAFLMLVNRMAGFVLPAASKLIIDEVIIKGRSALLAPIALAATAATLLQAFTSFSLSQTLSVTAQRAITEMRKKLQAHVERLPVRHFDSTQTGKLISRIMADGDYFKIPVEEE
jgi:ABC-type bacteriocin/lantibiotic exporter with double-glycine peptidase domain